MLHEGTAARQPRNGSQAEVGARGGLTTAPPICTAFQRSLMSTTSSVELAVPGKRECRRFVGEHVL